MDDIRDNTPDGEIPPDSDQSPDADQVEPRWTIDESGNVKGVIFTFDSTNLIMFDDQAITDPGVLAALKKPKT